LDEPTTFLDERAVARLEAVLDKCGLPRVIVSHDREFLGRVVASRLRLEGGVLVPED
jgi:ATPase subunit of ABC transporter with duplicated ATPase domains